MTTTTPLVSDVVTYVRRIIKQPNTEDISDETILDYFNRFYVFDMPSRIQLFDLRTRYQLELEPDVDRYQAPITILPGGAVVPTYNSFLTPAYIDGYQIVMQQSQDQWNKLFPNLYQNNFQESGDGTAGPYTFTISNGPLIRGFRDENIQPATTGILVANEGLLSSAVWVTAQDGSGNNLVLQDAGDGTFIGDGSGTINYTTGAAVVTFSAAIPSTSDINSQSIPYTAGRPQAVLFYDDTFSFRPVPSQPFLFEIDAYYNPASFLATSNSIPYRWMAEYFARGTARKILQDYGDTEQMALYEPMFREQECLVLRRTTRQNSNTRTATIYQGQTSFNTGGNNAI